MKIMLLLHLKIQTYIHMCIKAYAYMYSVLSTDMRVKSVLTIVLL